MPRMLVAYDPSWPEQFDAAAARLRRVGDPDWVIEHIGSTAVPGMRAKPVIDIAVRLGDGEDFERHRSALEGDGWRSGTSVRTHPVMILESGDGIRSHIAHFFAAEGWDAVHQRVFRDWLIAHPGDAERYRRAKCAAVATAARGGSTYNQAKAPVIQEIVDRARSARGWVRVDISDR